MPHFLVEELSVVVRHGKNFVYSDRDGSSLSIAQAANHEEAARLHYEKRLHHDRHRLCMNTPALILQVSRIGLIGPLCPASDSRVFDCREDNGIVVQPNTDIAPYNTNRDLT